MRKYLVVAIAALSVAACKKREEFEVGPSIKNNRLKISQIIDSTELSETHRYFFYDQLGRPTRTKFLIIRRQEPDTIFEDYGLGTISPIDQINYYYAGGKLSRQEVVGGINSSIDVIRNAHGQVAEVQIHNPRVGIYVAQENSNRFFYDESGNLVKSIYYRRLDEVGIRDTAVTTYRTFVNSRWTVSENEKLLTFDSLTKKVARSLVKRTLDSDGNITRNVFLTIYYDIDRITGARTEASRDSSVWNYTNFELNTQERTYLNEELQMLRGYYSDNLDVLDIYFPSMTRFPLVNASNTYEVRGNQYPTFAAQILERTYQGLPSKFVQEETSYGANNLPVKTTRSFRKVKYAID